MKNDAIRYRSVVTGLAICAELTLLPPAHSGTPTTPCFKIGTGNHLGFIDRTGSVVTVPTYEYCGTWHENRLWVREESRDRFSGNFIGADGRPLTDLRLGDLYDVFFENPNPEFLDGIAVVALDSNRYAYMSADGRLLGLTRVQLFADRRASDTNLLGVFEENVYGYVLRDGKIAISPHYEDARAFHNDIAAAKLRGKWGLIGIDGGFRVEPQYDEIYELPDEPHLWRFRVKDKWGLVDVQGNERLSPMYDEIIQCKHGLVTARDGSAYRVLGLGDHPIVMSQRFESVGSIGADVSLAKWQGKWGVVSPVRGVIIGPRFDSVVGFNDDGISMVRQGGRIGLVRSDGRIVCDPRFEDIWSSRDGVQPFSYGGKWGFLRVRDGQFFSDPQYERIKGYESFKDGLAIVKDGGGWGLLSLSSNKLVVPCAYANMTRWNDLFAAEKEGVYVLFSMTGKEIVSANRGIAQLPKPHEMVREFGIVRAKSGVGIVTRSGLLALPLEYEDAGIPSEGTIPVKKAGLWGYLDMAGAVAITRQFAWAGSFRDGVAAVKIGSNYGYIDRTGKQVVRPTYADAGHSLHDLLPVAKTKKVDGVDVLKWGLVNHLGDVVLPVEYDCIEWGDLEDGKTRFYGRICWQQL